MVNRLSFWYQDFKQSIACIDLKFIRLRHGVCTLFALENCRSDSVDCDGGVAVVASVLISAFESDIFAKTKTNDAAQSETEQGLD